MSNSRVKKPIVKSRGTEMALQGDHFRARREEHFQLHDEADLVNFRADALNRYITNQDLLENVALKLLHTSRLVPPSSFPKHHKKLYEVGALEAELVEVVRGLKRGELFSGDLRLMRAKQQLGAQEIKELQAEISATADSTGENDASLLSEETRFQKQAVARLTAALAKCVDAETLLALEETLKSTLQEYKSRFKREYTNTPREVTKHAIPLAELAPETPFSEAPANYNPRLIMSFVDLGAKVPSMPVPTSGGGGRNADRIAHEISRGIPATNSRNGARPEGGMQVPTPRGGPQFNSGADYAMAGASSERFDDFGILGDENNAGEAPAISQPHIQSRGHVNNQPHAQSHDNTPFDPQLMGAAQVDPIQEQNLQHLKVQGGSSGDVLPAAGSAGKTIDELTRDTGSGPGSVSASGPGTGQNIDPDTGAEHEEVANDVDMDDLDQFLAGSGAGDDIDDMDALMNFDHANENDEVMGFSQGHNNEEPNLEEDDPFNVDFLTHMGD